MADPTLPGPWAPDEAPGPTCNLGEARALDLAHGAQLDDIGSKLGLKRHWQTDAMYRERIRRAMNGPAAAPCSLLPAAGACDAHRALVDDNARLRAELAALVQTGEKLRQDLDRLSGQALDLGRDTGRIHRALDEAGVPRAAPEPGKPWRIDDRVQWALERLQTTGELVDHLEGQLAATGAELADVRHQLARLQLSACRLVAVNGGRA